MIFLKLFLVFSKIGIFNFGGGYAMLSLIHNEVVVKNSWLTNSEFADIVAISQSTPGPIGINSATYVGYTAVMNEGYPQWAAILGAVLATLSVIWLPFILMLTISRFLLKHGKSKPVNDVFSVLRPAIVGLIAAAALLLMSKENFSSPQESWFQFIVSILLFCFAFVGTRLYKIHPILMILLCGVAGLMNIVNYVSVI
jgi:chromate transporter